MCPKVLRSCCRVTNRTLILPEFSCWCDNDQVATVLETCASRGTDLILPFRCPADHLLHMPTVELLAAPIRQSGFLRRPQVRAQCFGKRSESQSSDWHK